MTIKWYLQLCEYSVCLELFFLKFYENPLKPLVCSTCNCVQVDIRGILWFSFDFEQIFENFRKIRFLAKLKMSLPASRITLNPRNRVFRSSPKVLTEEFSFRLTEENQCRSQIVEKAKYLILSHWLFCQSDWSDANESTEKVIFAGLVGKNSGTPRPHMASEVTTELSSDRRS